MRIVRLCLSVLLVTNLQPVLAGMNERVGADGVIYFSPVQQPTVVMYAVPDCGYCRQARDYFARRGIEYAEYNINKSNRRLREFRRLGGRGTPLIRVGGQTIQGFNRQAIEAALNQQE